MSARRRTARWGALILAAAQAVLGARVAVRLARTAWGRRIAPVSARQEGEVGETVAVVVPVLNEAGRLGPCLAGLLAQGGEVGEIVVVDGGSGDGTGGLVREAAERDGRRRLRLIEAGQAPAGWNGKVHNLARGAAESAADHRWLLTIDADVRPGAGLAAALVAFARDEGLAILSVATRQRLSGPAEAMLHPALLTTLVYRFGIPGSATDRVDRVQANGQCLLVRRDALASVGGFSPLRDSLCEDVTLARSLADAGYRVGFYETDDLVAVEMYDGWRDAWRNWTRSLPMRDRFFGRAGWLGLAEVALVQAAPLPLALALLLGSTGWGRRGEGVHKILRPSSSAQAGAGALSGQLAVSLLTRLNLLLLAMRLGVLAGTARAYEAPPWSYWLSPACDVAAAVGVSLSAVRRRHEWRGRSMVRGGGNGPGGSA